MSNTFRIFSFISVLGSVLCCSCQESAVMAKGYGSVGTRNYSDAVVHINQVDPAYRDYFREQNSTNYSLSDQRKAYMAAAQTARTPVRESDYKPGDIRKQSVAKNKARTTKGKARLAQKGKAKNTSSSSVRKGAVAARKPYRRR